jgi:3',5'-cyclic AMP phosphodiesterase CpdA
VPTILWTSDPHLDHASDLAREEYRNRLRDAPGAVLVSTGDTSVKSRLSADLEFLADAAARPLYLVLGNHDHYGGSVAAVRDGVAALGERRPDIRWLPPAGVVSLDPETALIGVDGWADGRHGDPLTTPFVLNDDRLIAEIAAQQTRTAKLAVKRALADADGRRLLVLLDRAVTTARTIVIATHVPPFVEALPGSGPLAQTGWLPLLVCDATGTVIRRAAAQHPDHNFLVLCGHTHAATDVRIAANLRCVVAGARYGEPRARTIEV